MNYNIKITDFEGPLDLLLHLIKTNDMDIFDINIETVTNQYLNYIKAMEELNLNIASEYLVMAAELMFIKSKLLLPKETIEIEDVEYIDPEELLKEKLLTYQKYKEVTEDLKESEEKRQEYLTKVPSILDEYVDGVVTYTHADEDVDTLVEAFKKFLKRKEESRPLNTKVMTKEISVNDRRKTITSILNKKNRVSFDELFEIRAKAYIVVTFLALLEMYKKKEIEIVQDNNFKDITITKGANINE